mgnify:CR=1 FL=1
MTKPIDPKALLSRAMSENKYHFDLLAEVKRLQKLIDERKHAMTTTPANPHWHPTPGFNAWHLAAWGYQWGSNTVVSQPLPGTLIMCLICGRLKEEMP